MFGRGYENLLWLIAAAPFIIATFFDWLINLF